MAAVGVAFTGIPLHWLGEQNWYRQRTRLCPLRSESHCKNIRRTLVAACRWQRRLLSRSRSPVLSPGVLIQVPHGRPVKLEDLVAPPCCVGARF